LQDDQELVEIKTVEKTTEERREYFPHNLQCDQILSSI